MRVPYSEGLATHTDPESCVYIRKGMGEALTGGVRAGLLSRERIFRLWGADAVHISGRQYRPRRYRERWSGPAWSETPSTDTNSLRGNREVPRLASGDGAEVRAVNLKGVRQR
jgi:hypothetical protein